MNIGERIKQRREELGMSQDELAKKIGYKSRSSINKIELDGRGLPQKKIKAFSVALDTSIAYLMGWDVEEPESTVNNIYTIRTKSIPVIGSVACGQPVLADQKFESYVLAGAEVDCDFALRASGDSMINARINDSDIVFIKKQSMVDNGDIACVIVNDDYEATLKRFYYYADRKMLILRAENPKYEDMIFVDQELQDVKVLGKAVAFQSDVR